MLNVAILKTLCTACLFVLALSSAHAAPISYGALSSNDDGSTEIITDSLNNLQWLRWDVLADLNYTQTLAAIGSGGAYEGWQIAHNSQAQMFIDALFSPASPSCNTSSGGSQLCGNITSGLAPLFGDNYDAGFDFAFFLNDASTIYTVGILEHNNSNGGINEYENWGTIANSDKWSQTGVFSERPITWLLYRDPALVPVPAAAWLFLSALGGLVLIKSKKS